MPIGKITNAIRSGSGGGTESDGGTASAAGTTDDEEDREERIREAKQEYERAATREEIEEAEQKLVEARGDTPKGQRAKEKLREIQEKVDQLKEQVGGGDGEGADPATDPDVEASGEGTPSPARSKAEAVRRKLRSAAEGIAAAGDARGPASLGEGLVSQGGGGSGPGPGQADPDTMTATGEGFEPAGVERGGDVGGNAYGAEVVGDVSDTDTDTGATAAFDVEDVTALKGTPAGAVYSAGKSELNELGTQIASVMGSDGEVGSELGVPEPTDDPSTPYDTATTPGAMSDPGTRSVRSDVVDPTPAEGEPPASVFDSPGNSFGSESVAFSRVKRQREYQPTPTKDLGDNTPIIGNEGVERALGDLQAGFRESVANPAGDVAGDLAEGATESVLAPAEITGIAGEGTTQAGGDLADRAVGGLVTGGVNALNPGAIGTAVQETAETGSYLVAGGPVGGLQSRWKEVKQQGFRFGEATVRGAAAKPYQATGGLLVGAATAKFSPTIASGVGGRVAAGASRVSKATPDVPGAGKVRQGAPSRVVTGVDRIRKTLETDDAPGANPENFGRVRGPGGEGAPTSDLPGPRFDPWSDVGTSESFLSRVRSRGEGVRSRLESVRSRGDDSGEGPGFRDVESGEFDVTETPAYREVGRRSDPVPERPRRFGDAPDRSRIRSFLEDERAQQQLTYRRPEGDPGRGRGGRRGRGDDGDDAPGMVGEDRVLEQSPLGTPDPRSRILGRRRVAEQRELSPDPGELQAEPPAPTGTGGLTTTVGGEGALQGFGAPSPATYAGVTGGATAGGVAGALTRGAQQRREQAEASSFGEAGDLDPVAENLGYTFDQDDAATSQVTGQQPGTEGLNLGGLLQRPGAFEGPDVTPDVGQGPDVRDRPDVGDRNRTGPRQTTDTRQVYGSLVGGEFDTTTGTRQPQQPRQPTRPADATGTNDPVFTFSGPTGFDTGFGNPEGGTPDRPRDFDFDLSFGADTDRRRDRREGGRLRYFLNPFATPAQVLGIGDLQDADDSTGAGGVGLGFDPDVEPGVALGDLAGALALSGDGELGDVAGGDGVI